MENARTEMPNWEERRNIEKTVENIKKRNSILEEKEGEKEKKKKENRKKSIVSENFCLIALAL